MSVNQLLTAGEFPTEVDAWADFDERAERSECFSCYHEVTGQIIQPRVAAEVKAVRIDRILVPKRKLIEAGWPHGPVGVEGKKSEEKVGPAVAQALDYSRSLFDLGTARKSPVLRMPGFHVMVEWVFIWPINPERGDIVSFMMQHRIGSVHVDTFKHSLVFRADSWKGIEVFQDGRVQAKALPMGRKAGSR